MDEKDESIGNRIRKDPPEQSYSQDGQSSSPMTQYKWKVRLAREKLLRYLQELSQIEDFLDSGRVQETQQALDRLDSFSRILG